MLVLLLMLSSGLQTPFSGLNVVELKLSNTDYVVHTPDRKRLSRVCHVNMLKSYVALKNVSLPPLCLSLLLHCVRLCPLRGHWQSVSSLEKNCVCSAHLGNIEMMNNFSLFLSQLPSSARHDIVKLRVIHDCYKS